MFKYGATFHAGNARILRDFEQRCPDAYRLAVWMAAEDDAAEELDEHHDSAHES